MWKEDLEALAQAKKSSLLDNFQAGLPGENGGSFLDDTSFEFPYVAFYLSGSTVSSPMTTLAG